MASSKVDLIIHPVRFRILQTLSGESLTTQEIAARLSDVPKSSIYRHLRLLLDAAMIGVAETRLVKGIQEKRYKLVQRPYLGPDDVDPLTADEHLRHFTTYLMTVLQGFSEYLEDAQNGSGAIDMVTDRVGYTEALFFATSDELDGFQVAINEALSKLLDNRSGPGRRKHKIALVTHPIRSKGSKET